MLVVGSKWVRSNYRKRISSRISIHISLMFIFYLFEFWLCFCARDVTSYGLVVSKYGNYFMERRIDIRNILKQRKNIELREYV